MIYSKPVISRQDFLRGFAASLGLGAFGGLRLFAAPAGWKHSGKANLVVGIVSDTHLITDKEGRLAWLRGPDFNVLEAGNPAKYFAAALKYFRDENVDAVMHCGDITDSGQIREMEAAAALWRRAFPNDLAPDGHKVEKLFVTGNHDAEGIVMRWLKKTWPDSEERKRLSFTSDIPGVWKRIWGEKYEPVWHKTVKGYHFFGRNWETDWTDYQNLFADFDVGSQERPFFMVTHSEDGRSDEAKLKKSEFRKSMANCRNAVTLRGHWHQSITNWNMILFWLNDFTPEIQCPSCAVFGGLAPHHDGWIFKNHKAGVNAREIGKWRQGMVMRVYDDMIVFERKEFGGDGTAASLGADWVMPLERGTGNGEWGTGKHPFARDELKKKIGVPQFREGAKLEVSLDRIDKINKIVKTSNNNPVNPVNPVQDNSASPRLRVKIPLADGNPDSRVYAYEVAVTGDAGSPTLYKSIYDAGCNLGIGREPGVTTLEIPSGELPPGKELTVAVRPMTSLGTTGAEIVAKFQIEA